MSDDYYAVCDKCQVYCYFGKVSSWAHIGYGRHQDYLDPVNEFVADLEQSPRNAIDFLFQHADCSPSGARVTNMDRSDADDRVYDLNYKRVKLDWEYIEAGRFLWTDLYKEKFTEWGERIERDKP